MATAGLDDSGLRAKLARYRRNAPAARLEVLEHATRELVSEVVANEPRDTNRLVRGYMLAANQAGVGNFAVPAVKEGSFLKSANIQQRLESQLARWDRIVQSYERKGRRDKWYNRAVKTRDRAREELAKLDPTSIAIFGNSKKRRLDVTVRNKVYGGKGFRSHVAGRTFITIHNLEPHASIVESRNRVVRSAQSRMKAFGVKRYSRAYLRRMGVAA